MAARQPEVVRVEDLQEVVDGKSQVIMRGCMCCFAFSSFYMVSLPSFLHAKRSAVTSRRYDLSPERSVVCQPQGVGHRNSRVSADLLSPGGRRSASGTPPVATWPDTVLCFAAGPKDPICWYIVSKPGNMTEQSETSFANDGRSCQQTSATGM